MKLRVGDRVKFLKENGGGVVSKVISPRLVNVAIADGFEIPVLAGELIRIEEEAPADSPKHMFREDFDQDFQIPAEEPLQEDDRNLRLINNPAKGTVPSGVYLAFIPEDQKWIITGLLDVYLVNHTRYDILYSFFLEKEDGSFRGFDYGSVEPESMVLLESIERDKLNNWERGVVQALFHSDSAKQIVMPGNSNFKVKLPRFYNETNYTESGIIDGKSILISLMPIAAQAREAAGSMEIKDTMPQVTNQKASEVKPVHIIDKHKTSPREAVVDLHIEDILEDHQGMDNSQILRAQVNYFTRCLENAIANNLTKVTFIHGVGTGVLKTTIKLILKDYPSVTVTDSSMKQFGYGALDVLLG